MFPSRKENEATCAGLKKENSVPGTFNYLLKSTQVINGTRTDGLNTVHALLATPATSSLPGVSVKSICSRSQELNRNMN